MAALLLRLSLPSFVTVSRRNRAPESLSPGLTPALMLVSHKENYERPSASAPAKITLHLLAIMYVDVGNDENAIPDAILNGLLDQVTLALAPDQPNLGRTTLGGLVQSVMIDGEITKAPGDVPARASPSFRSPSVLCKPFKEARMSDPTSTVDAPTPADQGNSPPAEVPVAPVTPTTRSGPIDSLIDGWFADHFSDQVFARESKIWDQAYQAKEQLKAIIAATNTPAFDGLVDQWFWDSFSNSEFSYNVSVWNLAYDAKQKLKFRLATR